MGIYTKVKSVCFSATGNTRMLVLDVCQGIGLPMGESVDILEKDVQDLTFQSDELVVFGVPVFAGRVPVLAVERLRHMKASGTPAVILVSYGNRAFDDALIELYDLVRESGFEVISAGAFVAQHSIFPQVAFGRPDSTDHKIAYNFGLRSMERLRTVENLMNLPPLKVQGSQPYREPKAVPLVPKVSRHCNDCGRCARKCPVQAIDPENPKRTDPARCIACAHCISICPKEARRFGGLLYWVASKKFARNYSSRQEAYMVYR